MCKDSEAGTCFICLKNCKEAGIAKSESMREAVGTMKAKGTKDLVGHDRILALATLVFLLSLKPHSHHWALVWNLLCKTILVDFSMSHYLTSFRSFLECHFLSNFFSTHILGTFFSASFLLPLLLLSIPLLHMVCLFHQV